MVLHRVRAHIRFTPQSGLATWCRDQMVVRHGQAVHIRQGEPEAEAPINTTDGEFFRCDLALADEAAATDALATLGDHNVLGLSLQHETLDGPEPSWVEYHRCDHVDDDRDGCVVVERRLGP